MLLYLLRADPKAACWPQDSEPPLKGTSAPLCHSHPFFQLHSLQLQAGKQGRSRISPAHIGSTATSHFHLRGKEPKGIPPALASHLRLWQGAQEEEATTTTTGQCTAQPIRRAPCAASMVSGPDKSQPSEGCVHHG